jgi:hypothetical protein
MNYTVKTEKVPSSPGCWDVLKVMIFQDDKQIGEYNRNYSCLYDTFFPFEQNGKHYALYSRDYTGTRVMSLPDCVDICGEEPNSNGFCPTGYYVPKESKGMYGFISGCFWGDDSSWKIQYLDLSEIEKRIIKREERFGYLELPSGLDLKGAINVVDDEDGLIEVAGSRIYNIKSSKEDNAFYKMEDSLTFGEPMVKLFDLLEKYCKKCGYYSSPRKVRVLATPFGAADPKYVERNLYKDGEVDPFCCKCDKK